MAMMMIGTNDPREAEMIMIFGPDVRTPLGVVKLQENVSLALNILETMGDIGLPLRASEIAEILEVSPQRVETILHKLATAGKIVRFDTKRTENHLAWHRRSNDQKSVHHSLRFDRELNPNQKEKELTTMTDFERVERMLESFPNRLETTNPYAGDEDIRPLPGWIQVWNRDGTSSIDLNFNPDGSFDKCSFNY